MSFARAYMNVFIVFSNTLEEHLRHLDTFFARLDSLNFTLAPKKANLGVPSIRLLGRKVDGYGYSTTEERRHSLQNLRMPTTVAKLESYIGI
ncbi:hypothetical protein BDU57DRAFT_462584, partial [Ampelomyces quisqualis]